MGNSTPKRLAIVVSLTPSCFLPPSCPREAPLSLSVERWWWGVLVLGFSCCLLNWMLEVSGLKIPVYFKRRPKLLDPTCGYLLC